MQDLVAHLTLRDIEQIRIPAIRFLGEQDGPVERELKSRLSELFAREDTIATAYLARVHYRDSPTDSIALCLRADVAQRDVVADKVGVVFASLFNEKEHLDIMFLEEEMESAVSECCRNFYAASPKP